MDLYGAGRVLGVGGLSGLMVGSDPATVSGANNLVVILGFAGVVVATMGTYLVGRRNARITERKNQQDAEDNAVEHWQAVAKDERAAKESALSEERASKASALATSAQLLEVATGQTESLRRALDSANKTISAQQTLIAQAHEQGTAAAGLIVRLEEENARAITERDQAQKELTASEARVEELRKDLLNEQAKILELTIDHAPSLTQQIQETK